MHFLLVQKPSLTETRVVNAHPIKGQKGGTWKEKYLKYEIETVRNLESQSGIQLLEKKSISSMRLKQ